MVHGLPHRADTLWVGLHYLHRDFNLMREEAPRGEQARDRVRVTWPKAECTAHTKPLVLHYPPVLTLAYLTVLHQSLIDAAH